MYPYHATLHFKVNKLTKQSALCLGVKICANFVSVKLKLDLNNKLLHLIGFSNKRTPVVKLSNPLFCWMTKVDLYLKNQSNSTLF